MRLRTLREVLALTVAPIPAPLKRKRNSIGLPTPSKSFRVREFALVTCVNHALSSMFSVQKTM